MASHQTGDFASIAISVIAVANRELAIPRYKDQLVRNAQSWDGETPQPMQCRVDYENDYFFSGNQVIPAEFKILKPSIHLDATHTGWGNRINAEQAIYHSANDDHPGGYLCSGVSKPRDLNQLKSLRRDDRLAILAPAENRWLEADECFIVSQLDFDQLVNGDQLLQYSNTFDLVKSIRNPSQDYGAGLRVSAHARILRPILDISLLMLGLPIVVARRDRNIFVAAGMCVGLIAVFIITTMVFGGLGAFGMIPPYAAAWAPVAVFVPIAAVACGTLNQ